MRFAVHRTKVRYNSAITFKHTDIIQVPCPTGDHRPSFVRFAIPCCIVPCSVSIGWMETLEAAWYHYLPVPVQIAVCALVRELLRCPPRTLHLSSVAFCTKRALPIIIGTVISP